MPTDVFALPDMLRDTAFADAWFSAEGDRAAFEIAAHAAAATLEQALREHPVVRVSDLLQEHLTHPYYSGGEWHQSKHYTCMVRGCPFKDGTPAKVDAPHAEWCPVGQAGAGDQARTTEGPDLSDAIDWAGGTLSS